MKANQKLKLEKFRIAQLSNPQKIIGGTGDAGTETRTEGICIKNSEVYQE